MALQKTPPNTVGIPSSEFSKPDFDAAIWNKGYDIIIEKGVRCPCEGEDGTPLSNCQNCLGSGYFYINPFETRAIATNINSETEYKEWSVEKRGTISLSVIDDRDEREFLSFYDRVTLVRKRKDTPQINSQLSETVQVRTDEVSNFVFLTYKPQEIIEVWVFNGVGQKHTKLDSNLYSINSDNGYALNIDESVNVQNKVVSVRYRHDIQFKVIDVPHDLRYSTIKDNNGKEQVITLPIQAIAVRMHLVDKTPNYDGTGLLDNTYNQ